MVWGNRGNALKPAVELNKKPPIQRVPDIFSLQSFSAWQRAPWTFTRFCLLILSQHCPLLKKEKSFTERKEWTVILQKPDMAMYNFPWIHSSKFYWAPYMCQKLLEQGILLWARQPSTTCPQSLHSREVGCGDEWMENKQQVGNYRAQVRKAIKRLERITGCGVDFR